MTHPVQFRRKVLLTKEKEGLINDIKHFPDSYSYERAGRLGVSKSGITYALKRLNIRYKKNSHSPEGGSRKKIYILPTDKGIEGSR